MVNISGPAKLFDYGRFEYFWVKFGQVTLCIVLYFVFKLITMNCIY